MIKSDFLNQFNTLKVVCMMEISPLSDIFEPIMLTLDQRKKVLDLLASFCDKEKEGFVVITDADFRTKITNIRDVYEPKEIQETV